MNIQEAKSLLPFAARVGDSVLITGKHGIGKSQVVEQFARESNYYSYPLFLSHQEVGDIIGNPITKVLDGVEVTTWTVPIWLQRMREYAARGIPCVLFLDELNRAPLDVRQSALQLVLEGKIHEHELPIVNGQKTFVVSAINPSDEYQVDELDPALLDRFTCYEVEPDLKAFTQHGKEVGMNRCIIDFLQNHPDRLHFTPQDGAGKGTSPRTWSKLNPYLDQDIPPEMMYQVFKGRLGEAVGAQFHSFWRNYSDIVTVEDIISVIDREDFDESVEQVRELTHSLEAIIKTELAEQLADKKRATTYDLLVFLYSLETEILMSYLKGIKGSDQKLYAAIAELDNELHNKALFRRLVKSANKG